MPCNHDWIQANMPGYRLCVFCGTQEERPGIAWQEKGFNMKITTHRSDRPGEYSVFLDGRDTGLVIVRGDAPKFGMAQEWDVCDRDDTYLFSARGKAQCLAVIQHIVDRCAQAATTEKP